MISAVHSQAAHIKRGESSCRGRWGETVGKKAEKREDLKDS